MNTWFEKLNLVCIFIDCALLLMESRNEDPPQWALVVSVLAFIYIIELVAEARARAAASRFSLPD